VGESAANHARRSCSDSRPSMPQDSNTP
jgi:hypothetical protein